MTDGAPPVTASESGRFRVPVSVLLPTRNEELNIGRCLASLRWADEVVVVDSQSRDATVRIAESFGAKVIQFRYDGGWPKKRQWALDTFPFRNEWILLLDADEIVPEELGREIDEAIRAPKAVGYCLRFQIYFLGRQLQFGDTELWKLVLFRKGHGRYECRAKAQDATMGDMEVHEHFMVDGPIAKLRTPVRHENVNTLYRYIDKHNEYSNWEATVLEEAAKTGLKATPFGNQAQRRRWLKRTFLFVPGSPVALFVYKYIARLGVLDGAPGLIYCAFQAVQVFHVKAKAYERRVAKDGTTSGSRPERHDSTEAEHSSGTPR